MNPHCFVKILMQLGTDHFSKGQVTLLPQVASIWLFSFCFPRLNSKGFDNDLESLVEFTRIISTSENLCFSEKWWRPMCDGEMVLYILCMWSGKLSCCMARTEPGKGGFSNNCNGGTLWSQSLVLACHFQLSWIFEWHSYLEPKFPPDILYWWYFYCSWFWFWDWSQKFWQLFFVDGIYPELTWFVKSLQELIGNSKVYYSKLLEGTRKDIEREFGVFRREFQVLTCSFELWLAGDIHDTDMTCVILHNVMVTVRIDQNECLLWIFEPQRWQWMGWLPCSSQSGGGGSFLIVTCSLQNEQASAMLKKTNLSQSFAFFSNGCSTDYWQSWCDNNADNLLHESIISELASHQTNINE